ncbi:hypothetical protein GCM10017643_12660 [Ancylobacter dichloromethanicus]|uniref:Uncharacterized protein n=1 Tax=Ancylobacter dichloromethanicus TaxID=518825 RepID=A0A9W6J7B1_9HYPH|nr:hypothetical protein GCM10017643_12660 [Ancylobacter dichloromethanicus]
MKKGTIAAFRLGRGLGRVADMEQKPGSRATPALRACTTGIRRLARGRVLAYLAGTITLGCPRRGGAAG